MGQQMHDVAILLEIARIINAVNLETGIDIILFDAEDQGVENRIGLCPFISCRFSMRPPSESEQCGANCDMEAARRVPDSRKRQLNLCPAVKKNQRRENRSEAEKHCPKSRVDRLIWSLGSHPV